ncbi:uncharacterized protein LOC135845366 [Planococcus citri]|uniref:uncharacterized protein LOC135845366 n=1 Tax=Planococcus citri TaxID=170843 RepID=UPI0031F8F777
MDDNDSEPSQSSNRGSYYFGENVLSDFWSSMNRFNHESDDSDSLSSDSSKSSTSSYDFRNINKIPTTVPRLETMASIRVAIALWNHAAVAIPGILSHYREWQSKVCDEVGKWIDALPVAKPIAKCLNQRFDRVKYDVNCWIHYHYYVVFFEDKKKRFLYRYIDGIVWRLSDVNSVNFAETARNLLKSDKLTNVEKFRLASTYCLREEALKIWSTIQEDDIDSVFFDPVIVYWKCYCSGKWDELSRENADQYMIGRKNANWSQIEYFFHRLDTEQQVEKTISLIEQHGIRFQELLLLKLNETQRVEVLTKKGTDILFNYARECTEGDKCIAIWHEVCDLITQEQFVSLFSDLLTSYSETLVLTEIWNTARNDFKRHILNHDNYNFIKKVFKWFSFKQERGLTFVTSLFSDDAIVNIKRKITKEQFFNEQCINFLARPYRIGQDELLYKFVELFYPEAAESTEFKRSLVQNPYFSERCERFIFDNDIAAFVELFNFGFSICDPDPSSSQFLRRTLSEHLQNFDTICLRCYACGDLERLNALLAPLISSYPEIVSEYKKNILFSNAGLLTCVDHFHSNNSVLSKIIADGVPTNLIPEFKRRMIFSPEGIRKLEQLIVDGQSNTVKKLINWCLQSGKARKKLKKLLKIV